MAKLGLTDRELEVVTAYARLGTQEAAANQLGVHKQTIKNHVQSAKQRAGAISTVQLLWMLLEGDTKLS